MGQVCGLPDAEQSQDRELVFDPEYTEEALPAEAEEEPKNAPKKLAEKDDLQGALDKVARRTGWEKAQHSSGRQTIPKPQFGRKEEDRASPKDVDLDSDDEEDAKWKSGTIEIEGQEGDSVADDAEEQLAEVMHYAYVDEKVDKEEAQASQMTEEEIEKARWQAEQDIMLNRAKKDAEMERETQAAEAAFDEA